MQKTRYLLYLVSIALVFALLSSIKFILPHPEPKKEIDEIGMRLYKPIFFGESDAPSQFQSEIKSDEAESLVDNVVSDNSEALETNEESIDQDTDPEDKKDTSDYLNKLIQDYRKNVLSQRKYRNDVVVRYYRHEPDGDQIKVLSPYGFYIHERSIPDETRFKEFGSNVIYYGHDFPESDLKLIAALLISEGMEIKSIEPFRDFEGWKHKSIEIGASRKLDNKIPLTLTDVINFRVSY